MEKPQQERVTEVQGLYGPLQVLEGKVQLVWALQMLQPGDWHTRSGKRLRIRRPGTWNRGPGPDFHDAVIELDGRLVVGDIELHLYREDWRRHGHHQDMRYERVVLHAVLFGGGMGECVRTRAGLQPEEWIFGPWMREDVESVSGGEPGLFGEHVPEMREWMESDTPEAIRNRLLVGLERRWEQKEAMARCLLECHGWPGALHRMTLYYLGFPANRRVFFEIAGYLEPGRWGEPELLDFITARWGSAIRWGTGRPTNRARPRLEQFIRLHQSRPDWAQRLRQPPPGLLQEASAGCRWLTASRRSLRREARIPEWRQWLQTTVMGRSLGETLADRLWSDVFLPALVVDGQLHRDPAMGLWFHGHPVSYPDAYRPLLRLCQVGGALHPVCNGWVQGLIWLEDQMRLERVRGALGSPCAASRPSGA